MSEKKKISKGKILGAVSIALGIVSWFVESMKEDEDRQQMINEIKDQVKEEMREEAEDQLKQEGE